MRVLLVTAHFPSLEHPYITEWVTHLWEKGVELVILAEIADELPDQFAIPSGRIRYSCNVKKPVASLWANRYAFVSLFSHPRLISRAARIISNTSQGWNWRISHLFEYIPVLAEHFDLIHFNAPQIAVRRFELRELLGTRTLVSFRGQDFTHFPERYTTLVEQADHVHFLSHHLLEEARAAGFSGDQYSIIPPMVDTGFYAPGKYTQTAVGSTNQFILYTAARFAWQKGWEYALTAVALLRDRGWDVQYYIAGDGDFKEAIVYTAHELGIFEHVHLLGWLSPVGIRNWMQKADLYVLASVEEAFNTSVLQAQSCGLPVVCVDAGGLPENIVNGQTGLLARRRDAWDLADKIEMLLRQPDLRLRMGEAARKRAASHFQIDQVTGQFVSLYQQLCSRT